MQTRTESFIETCINIATGFIVSLFVWQFIVAPMYHIPVNFVENLGITGIFTISAIIRQYFWRRFFANNIHKKIHRYVGENNGRQCTKTL